MQGECKVAACTAAVHAAISRLALASGGVVVAGEPEFIVHDVGVRAGTSVLSARHMAITPLWGAQLCQADHAANALAERVGWQRRRWW